MSTIPVSNESPRLTVEEYFKFDEKSEVRHEFNKGILRPMGDRSKRHNHLVGNAADIVKSVFRPRGCSVYTQSVKLEVVKNKHYAFPDVTLISHDFDAEDEYLMTFPNLIIEIAECTDEGFYQGTKFQRYQEIPSLKYYLIINEKQCWVDVYCRSEDPKRWCYHIYNEIESVINFPKLNFTMALSDIYKDTTFDPPETWDL